MVLSQIEGSAVSVVERPDRVSPGRAGCDAIVERGGVWHAVEHTTIDAYLGRRQDDARFRRVVMPVELAVAQEFTDSWIEIAVPAHAVPTGQDWDALRERFLGRICEAIHAMPIADYTDLSRTPFEWPDIPFPIWISRQDRREDAATCIMSRVRPEDTHDQLVAGITGALRDKSEQLRPYRGTMKTVLLLDFDDFVLLNQDAVAGAFARAAQDSAGADAIDEVYVVDGRRRRVWVFPVKLGTRLYPELPEFRQFFSEQFRMTYGRLA